jgi:hypothetical protein
MITVVRSTTNIRPAKTSDAEIMTTPTAGILRLNAPAVAAMGLSLGGFLDIVDAGEDGKPAYYLTAGTPASKDGKVSAVGSKLGSPNGKSGGGLQCSAANSYILLGGNSEKNVVYSVNVTPDVDANGKKYYAITEDRREAKQDKKTDTVNNAKAGTEKAKETANGAMTSTAKVPAAKTTAKV